MAAEEAWMVEYLIAGLQCMPNVLMSLERWMIVIENSGTKEMKALAIVQ